MLAGSEESIDWSRPESQVLGVVAGLFMLWIGVGIIQQWRTNVGKFSHSGRGTSGPLRRFLFGTEDAPRAAGLCTLGALIAALGLFMVVSIGAGWF